MKQVMHPAAAKLMSRIKTRVDQHLQQFITTIDRRFLLCRLPPLLLNNIRDFVLRDGKRIRPLLFITGFLGYSRKAVPNLYTCALAFELLHDFTLIHDDIIDKSETRRGRPAVHTMLNHYLARFKQLKCNGQDLAIVIGDILYAMALHAFLSIKTNSRRKERALQTFIETAICTGAGEFNELLYGAENIQTITKEHIYTTYDLKTAYYSFASPLMIGAELAGASRPQLDLLSRYGVCLGRAFQIQDDILGMFAREQDIGKSVLSDLQEAKKTILVWYAYRNAAGKDRNTIQQILSRRRITPADVMTMKQIISATGALGFARKEIASLHRRAQQFIDSLAMKKPYRELLNQFAAQLLQA